jgi:succinate-semialdehyde dehydrogenase/glutarate-semialdehyde dehydrogenase
MVTNIATIKSVNPATRELVGEVPCMGEAEVERAVSTAAKAYEQWRCTTFADRARLVLKLRKVILKQSDALAELITREVGKPISESTTAEINAALEACKWFADNSERLLKDQLVSLTNPVLSSKQSIVVFDPLGVIGIIAPWNFPFAIPLISMVMSLMCGNTVVLKPSEKSSLIGIRLGELFIEAGFPPGSVTVVTGDRTTGAALTRSKIARIIFTGSVEGGKKVMAQAAENLIPVTLELGGKDPAIVLPDAPPDFTAKGIVWGAFTNCGQACASVERVYIVRGKKTQELIDRIVSYTKALRVGSGIDPQTEVGPLIDESQRQKVKQQVDEACALGAEVLCGGAIRDDLGGFFYEPTVITKVNHEMTVMTEETFGPVLALMVVDSEDEAIRLANESQYGLSASVWTKKLAKAEDIAEDLEVGSVIINDGLFSFACPQVPWGGLKNSGMGRTHSYFGLLDLVNIKHVSIDAAAHGGRQWWFPYNRNRLQAAKGGIKLLHSTSPFGQIAGLFQFIGNSIFKSK